MTKRILLTGATGFVGKHIAARLLDDDIELVCLLRDSIQQADFKALQEKHGDNIQFAAGDILAPKSLEAAMQGAWGVINAAGLREFWARNRKDFYTLNETGADNVFQAALAAGVKKVVQVSTPLAFGVPDTIPFDEESDAGEHPSDYAKSKYLGDCAGWKRHREQGLPLTVVHLAAVIGAGDDKETMEIRRALDKEMPALIGADTTYTYVYVKDAADAVVKALLHGHSVGRRYLIGTERATTREYFGLIGEIANVPVPKMNIAEKLLMPMAKGMERISKLTGKRPMLPIDVLNTTAAGSLLFDGSRAIEELGMEYTPLRVALAEAIEALR